MTRGPRPQYDSTHRQASDAARAAHVAANGWWCEGDGDLHPVHLSTDLVADHVVAGQPEHGYRIVCRAWNSRRRALGIG